MLWTIKAASDFEYGYGAGKGRGALFRAAIGRSVEALARRGTDHTALASKARRHQALLAERYPAQLERLSGLARATGLEPLEVTAGALALGSLVSTGCTNFAAVPPATSNGNTYVSWNFDLSPLFRLLMGRTPLYVRDIAGKKQYVCLGLPVLFGIGIMNSDGLCSCVNSVSATDGGEGLMFFELNNLAMETQSTVDGAVGVWRDNPREVLPGVALSMIMNSNSIFADMSGDAAVIEHSHNYMAVEKAREHGGVIASANHHQFLDRALSGGTDPSMEPMITGSYARLARMWELLELLKGKIDHRTARIIVTDHETNYSTLGEFGISRSSYEERIDDATVCMHPWNFWRHLRRGEILEAMLEVNMPTLNNILIDPARCTVYFTRGNPCRNQYVPVWVGDALRMEWADGARGELDYDPALVPRAYSRRMDWFRRPEATVASDLLRYIALRFFAIAERLTPASVIRK